MKFVNPCFQSRRQQQTIPRTVDIQQETPRRCQGITRAAKQCSITDSCTLTNDSGRCVAEPLRRGGQHCLFHARPFVTAPVLDVDANRLVVVFLDLETTGTDIGSARILELAGCHAQSDARFLGGGFSSLVQVDPTILDLESSKQAETVHGISPQEVATLGVEFHLVWQEFLEWTEKLLNSCVADTTSDSEEESGEAAARQPQLVDAVLLLVAHNGFKFDFPFLIIELIRNRLSLASLESFLFADTLHVFSALERHSCKKLQCMVKTHGEPCDLRAHRGYDDCLAIQHVTTTIAEGLGLSLVQLLARFASRLDLQGTCAALSVMMEE